MEILRRDQKRRVREAHRFWIKVCEEIPIERAADKPLGAYVEKDVEISGIRRHPVKTHRALDLGCQPKAILPADVNLVVAPLIVGHRCGELDPAAAAHHQVLGVFVLDDQALLNGADSHGLRTSEARSGPGCR